MTQHIDIETTDAMMQFGERLGRHLQGGDVIELIGDVGAGKTTLVKGLARGLGISETVQSPSFTISQLYDGRDNTKLAHYDFYRLQDPGIMASELHEAVHDDAVITVIEWANVVRGVLSDDRLVLQISAPSELTRRILLRAGGDRAHHLLQELGA